MGAIGVGDHGQMEGVTASPSDRAEVIGRGNKGKEEKIKEGADASASRVGLA
jgi:hypothetical protein